MALHARNAYIMEGGESLMGGVAGVGFGHRNDVAFILVLFILLVIIACTCGWFGGGFGY